MSTSPKKLCFGLKKSKIDHTEQLLSFNYEKVELPIKYDLKNNVKKVYDQQEINSCSANATANFIRMSDNKHIINSDISRLYLYFCTRWIDNNKILPVQDSGATLKGVFEALVQYHYIDEDKYKYEIEKVNSIPPLDIFQEAIHQYKNPVISYRRIMPCKYSFKYIISHLKIPILFGMMVYDNFMNLTKDNDILSLPQKYNEMLGAHAVVIVGYEEDHLIILNSHGSNFADGGYFRMPWEYVLNPDLCFEFYILNSN